MLFDISRTHDLVQEIEQEVHPLSPPIRAAFLAIPRSVFVPEYYKQRGKQLLWTRTTADEVVYRNAALVTQVDARGLPSSSSSLPSFMALMLEALHLKPGLSVLEVGAGTGYNAAILAHIVGESGGVTTLDIDPELAAQARERLIAVGYGRINVQTGNGLQTSATSHCYDRIIATASFTHVPHIWIDQLKPGGILVMNLLLPLSHGLLALTKNHDGTASGRFLAQTNVAFMMLRVHEKLQPAPDGFFFHVYDAQPLLEWSDLSWCDFHAEFLKDPAFLFFLQLHYPHLMIKYKISDSFSTHYIVDETHTGIDFPADPDQIHTLTVRGSYNLWSLVKEVYQSWLEVSKPHLDAYVFELNPVAQWITLGSQKWKLV